MSGYVYFLSSDLPNSPIKIGHSFGPEARMAALAPWAPHPLEVLATTPGDLVLERNIQNCFADCHYHHEWFHPHQRLLDLIDGLRAGGELLDLLDLTDVRGNTLGLTQAATRRRNGTKLGRKTAVLA